MTSSTARPAALPRRPRAPLGRRIAILLARPQFRFGALVLIPTMLWYTIFVFLPIVQSIQLSVLDYDLLDPQRSEFAGLVNFADLLANPRFMTGVWNTVAWSAMSFVAVVPISLLLAACLAAVGRGRSVYQAVIFLPVVVSLVALGVLFRVLMDPEVGFFNRVLTGFGLPALSWLSSSDTALATLVGIAAWKSIGLYVVILTAGMLSIPGEIYDAAKVDGAGAHQTFVRITLPLLTPTLALVLVLLTIGSLQEFTLPTVVTGAPGLQGGPGESTLLYNLVIYDEAFAYVRFGTASAAALIEFVVILGVSLVWLRLLRSRSSY